VRQNPVEFDLPESVDRGKLSYSARPAYAPGAHRRLTRAGEVALPGKQVARFIRERAEENPVRFRTEGSAAYDSVATKIDGQRVVMTFMHDEETDAANIWSVALLVGATRKAKKAVRERGSWGSRYDGRSTGRVGLKALIWAREQIDLFQRELPEAIVVVGATDEKRARAYRALSRYGFKAGRYEGQAVMFRPAQG
jgi:hypothetical protein